MKNLIIFLTCMVIFIIKLSAAQMNAGKLIIYTVNYPLQYFAQRIAGEHAEVLFPAPADVDPAFWSPDLQTIKAYQGADLILLNGASYAKWIQKVTLPQFRIVNTSKAFKDDYIAVFDAVTHSHGLDGDHSHSGTAFTTWLDLRQAVLQAEAIAQALNRKWPDKREIFKNNFDRLKKDLLTLDREIEQVAGKKPGLPLFASHPVYQYFARRYNINLKSVMWEPQEFPAEEKWQALQIGLRNHPAKWMIWENEPNSESIRRLETLSIGSVVYDPCGNVPESGDFISVMKQNLENFKIIYIK